MFSISTWKARSAYTSDDPLQCGVMSTFGASQSGSSAGNGSGSVTSSAAPRIWPVSSAVIKAFWSIHGPRAMLTTYVPVFFELLLCRSSNSSVDSKCVVSFLHCESIRFASRHQLSGILALMGQLRPRGQSPASRNCVHRLCLFRCTTHWETCHRDHPFLGRYSRHPFWILGSSVVTQCKQSRPCPWLWLRGPLHLSRLA